MQRFLYIVDSYLDPKIHSILRQKGFVRDLDYSDSGTGGARKLFYDPEWIGAEKLLVFTSSFHGSKEEAVKFAEEVKEANPSAMIVFRSTITHCHHPVFDTSIEKEFSEFDVMMKIICEFFEI